MTYSPLLKLVGILIATPYLAAILLGVLLLPVVATYVFHRFRPESIFPKASVVSNSLILIVSFIILLGLGPPAGLDPVGLALLLFLLYYIPAWLALTLVMSGLMAFLRSSRGAP